MKKLLALAVSALIVAAQVGTAIPAYAAETETPIAEASGTAEDAALVAQEDATVYIPNGALVLTPEAQQFFNAGSVGDIDTQMRMAALQTRSFMYTGPALNKDMGTTNGPSGREVYYNLDMSQKVSQLKAMGYPFDYWVRSDGVKMFGPYIMCAANINIRPIGSLVESSLGTCMVTDAGYFAADDQIMIDIAVTW